MESLKGKKALVIGASSGIGRATLLALAGHGVRVTAVARNGDRLNAIAREAPGEAIARVGDATQREVVTNLLTESDPDMVVVCLGARPKMAPLDKQTWEDFSEVWNTDVKVAFHVCQEALQRPLKAGSVVVILSSGAAIGGSPLSGGYAGSKRMQWFMANYAQGVSNAKKLGIRFVAVVPKQLVVGTVTAETASSSYSSAAGITQEKYMERFGTPLTPEGVAEAIVKVVSGDIGPEVTALSVTGKGTEAL